MKILRFKRAILALSLCLGLARALTVVASGGSGRASGPAASTLDGQLDYASLHAPRTADDALPAQLAVTVASMNGHRAGVADELFEGVQLAEKSRRLMTGMGRDGISIYAYPTAKGRVCFITSHAEGGCVSRNDPVGWFESAGPHVGRGSTIRIVGIVPNNVASVAVAIGDRIEPAVVERNAFFSELAYDGAAPRDLILTLTNGIERSIVLPDVAALG